MSKFDTKVIGYLSYIEKTNLLCSGDACIVTGSEGVMSEYIKFLTTAFRENSPTASSSLWVIRLM